MSDSAEEPQAPRVKAASSRYHTGWPNSYTLWGRTNSSSDPTRSVTPRPFHGGPQLSTPDITRKLVWPMPGSLSEYSAWPRPRQISPQARRSRRSWVRPNKEATTPHEGKSARSRRVGRERGVCGVARLARGTTTGGAARLASAPSPCQRGSRGILRQAPRPPEPQFAAVAPAPVSELRLPAHRWRPSP